MMLTRCQDCGRQVLLDLLLHLKLHLLLLLLQMELSRLGAGIARDSRGFSANDPGPGGNERFVEDGALRSSWCGKPLAKPPMERPNNKRP